MNQHAQPHLRVVNPNPAAEHCDSSPDLHGAALVDHEGNETPITEDMLQRAFDALANVSAWKTLA